MSEIYTIDLNFKNEKHAIGAFIIKSSVGPILIETGPMTTYENLVKGVNKIGFNINDIKHVFLTHIHFDHAGAAWKLAENGANIYVHATGLAHLNNPEKLWNSAKLIYKDKMEELWGDMKSIPIDQLIEANDNDIFTFGNTVIKVIYTPGHAVHHNAYKMGDIIFTGDVAGVKINNGPIVPPCPPPDINIELWLKSINKLRDLKPKKLYLTHYDVNSNPDSLFNELEEVLLNWTNFIKPHFEKQTPVNEIINEFVKFTSNNFRKKGLSELEIKTYEYANPSWMSVNGLLRYWKLKSENRI